MPFVFAYILKLSISLAVVYLFYHLVLRKLTFYNWNRWYLLGYTLLSFAIACIDVTPALEKSDLTGNDLLRFIPSVSIPTKPVQAAASLVTDTQAWDRWDWLLLLLSAGAAGLLVRLCIRCLSFYRIRRHATLLSNGDMKLYQVDQKIIPFSFGNSIFINRQLHGEAELEEIIRHEFVHVKQKHTHDIILSELLCILNWYNPFAWLIRKAIRQNLEFIADHQVLQSGLDKKHYQYLLLKVIGNNHFSIASQFNFSSLKKRIVMMNKIKSTRAHALKFLFLLPVAAVLLLAFRDHAAPETTTPGPVMTGQDNRDTAAVPAGEIVFRRTSEGIIVGDLARLETPDVYGHKHLLLLNGGEVSTFSHIDKTTVTDLKMLFAREAKKKYGDRGKYGVVELYTDGFSKDTVPGPFVNEKGYGITIVDNKGNCMVIIKDRNRNKVESVLLTEWNKNKSYYENKYGLIPPPPPPVEPPPAPLAPPVPDHANTPAPLAPPVPDHANTLPPPPSPPASSIPAPGNPGRGKQLPSQTMIIRADSISWIAGHHTLYLAGKVVMDNSTNDVRLTAELANMNDNYGLVMINGREAEQGKDYTNYRGGTYKITSLNKEEATRKYGEKGKKGALEIHEIVQPG